LIERIDRLESSYENLQPSKIINSTKDNTFELSTNEKIHIQKKISLIAGIFTQSPYEVKEELKSGWKR